MKEFVMIYRSEAMPEVSFSPDEMQAILKQWENWMGSIAAQNKLVDRGNRLGTEGAIVKPNSIKTDGPYAEIKEFVGGFTIISADTLEEAVEIAKDCPILNVGGNVEIRTVVPSNS